MTMPIYDSAVLSRRTPQPLVKCCGQFVTARVCDVCGEFVKDR